MRARAAFLVSLALAFSLLAGCGVEQVERRSGTSVSVYVKSGGTTLTLTAQPRRSAVGGGMALTLTVTNTESKPVTYQLPSSQAFDFVAFHQKGAEVWRWSQGKVFAQVITPLTIDPAKSRIFTVSWDTAGREPGAYEVEGVFKGLPDVKPRVRVNLSTE
jgi:hypothetical protein